MTKRKLLITSLSIVSIIAVVFSLTIGSFAFFKYSKTEEASITTGTVDINILQDDFDGSVNNDTGVVANNKEFELESVGQNRTYARVFILPTVEYFNRNTGLWDTCGFISSDQISYTVSNPDWTLSDGYYYYHKILNTNDKTTKISIKNIKVEPTELDRYPDFIYRVVFSVNAEGCQASNNAYKLTWGQDCQLPANVEQYQGTDILVE